MWVYFLTIFLIIKLEAVRRKSEVLFSLSNFLERVKESRFHEIILKMNTFVHTQGGASAILKRC